MDVKKNFGEGEAACEQKFFYAARKLTLQDIKKQQDKN
jgi:hypothetical protein